MTQAELESIARKMRAKGLHSSWEELLMFSEDVVGGLVHAYQALLRNITLSNKTTSSDPSDVQKVVRDKLAAVLTMLTSEAQVARWESEVLAGNNILAHGKQETPGLEGSMQKYSQV